MVSPREFNQVISKHLYVESFVYVLKKNKHQNYIVSVHEITLNSGLTVANFILAFLFLMTF